MEIINLGKILYQMQIKRYL